MRVATWTRDRVRIHGYRRVAVAMMYSTLVMLADVTFEVASMFERAADRMYLRRYGVRP